MKKLYIWIAICLSLVLLLSGCSQSGIDAMAGKGYIFETPSPGDVTGSGSVNVYNWGEYMDEDLNKVFTELTGIKVNYKTYDTNESLYSVLKGGGTSYDVVIPSDYMISRMIDEDMLEPLDFTGIPNFSDIDPKLKNPDYDPGNLYSVPYTWGTVGLIYDKTRVSGTIDSWDALFDPLYSGEILMFSNPRDAFGIALKRLGYSLNTTDEAQLQEAYQLLVQQKPLVQKYLMDEIFDKLEGGGAIMGPYYAGDAITMMEKNSDLAFCIPKEGTNKFVDAFCIPKSAKNKTAAEMYINFMCSTTAGAANTDITGYSTPLLSVYEELPEDIKNDGISYPDSDDPRFEVFVNLPPETLSLYDQLWTDLLK